MELLAHQEEIISVIERGGSSGIYMPRQNGKTFAVIHAAWRLGGRTLLLTPGYNLSRHNFAVAEGIITNATKVRRRNGEQSITFPGGRIDFACLSKRGARGIVFDTIILDNADAAREGSLSPYMDSLAARPRIVLVGVAPDEGEASAFLCEQVLRYADPDPAKANPMYGTLISPDYVESERQSMHPEGWRRERLGISPREWEALYG